MTALRICLLCLMLTSLGACVSTGYIYDAGDKMNDTPISQNIEKASVLVADAEFQAAYDFCTPLAASYTQQFTQQGLDSSLARFLSIYATAALNTPSAKEPERVAQAALDAIARVERKGIRRIDDNASGGTISSLGYTPEAFFADRYLAYLVEASYLGDVHKLYRALALHHNAAGRLAEAKKWQAKAADAYHKKKYYW